MSTVDQSLPTVPPPSVSAVPAAPSSSAAGAATTLSLDEMSDRSIAAREAYEAARDASDRAAHRIAGFVAYGHPVPDTLAAQYRYCDEQRLALAEAWWAAANAAVEAVQS